MDLHQRLQILSRLGEYIIYGPAEWKRVKENAYRKNPWFTPEFIDLATQNIATSFLEENALSSWCRQYNIPEVRESPKNLGIVMAGNIPLVGFHDFLCAFVSGHFQTIKTSS